MRTHSSTERRFPISKTLPWSDWLKARRRLCANQVRGNHFNDKSSTDWVIWQVFFLWRSVPFFWRVNLYFLPSRSQLNRKFNAIWGQNVADEQQYTSVSVLGNAVFIPWGALLSLYKGSFPQLIFMTVAQSDGLYFFFVLIGQF